MERRWRTDKRPSASRRSPAAATAATAPWRNRNTTPHNVPSHPSRHNRDIDIPILSRSSTTNRSKASDDPELHESDHHLPLVGTCPYMCSEKEKRQRERLRDLSLFERLDGDPGQTSSSLAVKKFSRTISTVHWNASDIRPHPVLRETLNYLLNLLYYSNHPFEVVHDFIFDRTRSIRQDITMQSIVNDEAITLYEDMVKFHIVSHQRLSRSSDTSSISSLVHLNIEQLIKCLMSLYDMYGTKSRAIATRKIKAEFYSFYVLLHLGHSNQTMGESLSLWYRKLPSSILKSKQMLFARAVLRYFQMGNYVRFFRLLSSEASYLQLCLVEPVINEVRSRAILYVNNSGYKLHPYPLKHLSKILLLEESDLESLCGSSGLEVMTDQDTCGKFLPTKQMSFCQPKHFSRHCSFLGSEKLERWQTMCMDIRSLLHSETSE